MRNIKFRGQDTTGEWHYGDAVHLGEGIAIIENNKIGADFLPENNKYALAYQMNEFAVVYPNTVGQFTERKDKNGKELYEGDIFTINGRFAKVIKYDCGSLSYAVANVDDLKENHEFYDPWQHPSEEWWSRITPGMEIIGNVIDNPELLKKS